MISLKIYPLFVLVCILLGSLSASGQQDRCAFDYVQQQLIEQNPEYGAELAFYRQEILPQISQQANSRTVTTIVTIPVVVHVIHSGQPLGTGANLSVDRILSQIDILNEDYRRENTDSDQTPINYVDVAADVEVQFCLVNKDPEGNVSSGITRHVYSNIADINYIENTIKPETTWDPDHFLNIWTLDMPSSTILGYSYLPTSTIVGFPRDGVVINFANFGYIDEASRGRTCVHEVGHYLGLQHIWGAQDSEGEPIGCTSDDGVQDTPNSDSPYYGCPNFGISSCGSVDMTMNFMEYVNDNCMNLFTYGQKAIMQATLSGIRSNLVENAAVSCAIGDDSCTDFNAGPYETGFENNQPNNWIVENANADTRTWVITQNTTNDWGPNNGLGLAVYLWNINGITAADDYLFSPCFETKNNHTYRISFSYACAQDDNAVYNEDFAVGLSASQSSDDFTIPGSEWIFNDINNPYPEYNNQNLTFTANTDGFTSIGFHVYSPADRYALQIDDIRIEDLGTTNSAIEIEEKNHIRIGPNPSGGLFDLSMDFEKTQEQVNIRIININGQIIQEHVFHDVRQMLTDFELSEFSNGVYIFQVEASGFFLTEKVLLAK